MSIPPRKCYALDANWQFKNASDDGYLPVSQFPTNIHLDLFAHGKIPDPHVGKNELDIQWVGEQTWIYRTVFKTPKIFGTAKAVLAFDGLDTFATVHLNGEKILETENMFIPERVDVTKLLDEDVGGYNEIVITFESAHKKGWERVKEYPKHKYICSNGDISRLAVRKAQYHWGWDWGPTYITCGPWRPINLEVYRSRISDLWFDVVVDPSLSHATIEVHATIEGRRESHIRLLWWSGEDEKDSVRISNLRREKTISLAIDNPKLWWPRGYGDQSLYTFEAQLVEDHTVIDTVTKRIGLRRVELVQELLDNEPGTSFFFKVNNIPIFCGGSNWIPADNFLPRVTNDAYRDWVTAAAKGNQSMIRVWGGGIYEHQAFYDACDEQGILVWQDFMFACGNYPCRLDMRMSIKREAKENVKLLRHHPSIVIWAGNNEDYQIAEAENLTYNPEDTDPDNWLRTDFPARYIYEKILADVCEDLIPGTAYRFGSPWGGKKSGDPTVGDIHQWNVWHGTQEKYQNFDKLVGRFVSEFGMEAFPNIKTIEAFLPKGSKDGDRYSQSSTMDFHNKAVGHERRLALYLVENFRYSPDPLEYYIYCTQLMQAECFASAFRLWKRQWKGPGKEYCGGALVWQLNDCWPGISWSIRDYFEREKLAYYAIKREMEPLSIGIVRKEREDSKNTEIEIWACNLANTDLTFDVLVKAWDAENGVETFSQVVKSDVLLRRTQSTEVAVLPFPVKVANRGLEERTIVAAYLINEEGRSCSRYVNWPEPIKYLHLPKPEELKIDFDQQSGIVSISSDVPIKGLALEAVNKDKEIDNDRCDVECNYKNEIRTKGNGNVEFSDNLLDIVPGEEIQVRVEGAREGTVISHRYYGMI